MSEANVLRHLLIALGPDVPADDELLARFNAERDAGAFELLVWRHATLVLRVCRGILRDRHAAEDAAQATFLALARQARSVGRTGTVAGWLFRVARRIAARAARLERNGPATGIDLDRVSASEPASESDSECDRILHEELARLPEAYRVPVVLCYFSGLTHAEAARRLGWPVGTVAGRLSRARNLLAGRLTRRGVGLAALTAAPAVVVPQTFAGTTARAAVVFVAKGNTELPGHVLALANREVRVMVVTKAAWSIGVLAACAALAVGVVWAADQPAAPVVGKEPPAPAPRAAAPAIPKAVVGKTFAVAPITTDLQRELIDQGSEKSAAMVFVDGIRLFNEPKTIDLDALDLRGIRSALKSFRPGPERVVHLLTSYKQGQELHYDGTELLRLGLEGLARSAGFGTAYGLDRHGFDEWDKLIAPLKDEDGVDAEEKAVGDKRVQAYPVRTPLSRVLTNAADGVIVVRVQLDATKDDWVPAEVEKSVHAAIKELKLPKDGVVNFYLNIDHSAWGNDPNTRDEARLRIQKQARQWAETHDLKYGSVTQ